MDLVHSTLRVLQSRNVEQNNLALCKKSISQCTEVVKNRKDLCLAMQSEINKYSEELETMCFIKNVHDQNSNALKPLLRSSREYLNQIEEKLALIFQNEKPLKELFDENMKYFDKLKENDEKYLASLRKKSEDASECVEKKVHSLKDELHVIQTEQKTCERKLSNYINDYEADMKVVEILQVKGEVSKQNVEHKHALEVLLKIIEQNESFTADLTAEADHHTDEKLKNQYKECADVVTESIENQISKFTEHSYKFDQCLEQIRVKFNEINERNIDNFSSDEATQEKEFKTLDEEYENLKQQCEQLSKEITEFTDVSVKCQEDLQKESTSRNTYLRELETKLSSEFGTKPVAASTFQREVEEIEASMKSIQLVIETEETALKTINERSEKIGPTRAAHEKELRVLSESWEKLITEWHRLEASKREAAKKAFSKPKAIKPAVSTTSAKKTGKKRPIVVNVDSDSSVDCERMSYKDFMAKKKMMRSKHAK